MRAASTQRSIAEDAMNTASILARLIKGLLVLSGCIAMRENNLVARTQKPGDHKKDYIPCPPRLRCNKRTKTQLREFST